MSQTTTAKPKQSAQPARPAQAPKASTSTAPSQGSKKRGGQARRQQPEVSQEESATAATVEKEEEEEHVETITPSEALKAIRRAQPEESEALLERVQSAIKKKSGAKTSRDMCTTMSKFFGPLTPDDMIVAMNAYGFLSFSTDRNKAIIENCVAKTGEYLATAGSEVNAVETPIIRTKYTTLANWSLLLEKGTSRGLNTANFTWGAFWQIPQIVTQLKVFYTALDVLPPASPALMHKHSYWVGRKCSEVNRLLTVYAKIFTATMTNDPATIKDDIAEALENKEPIDFEAELTPAQAFAYCVPFDLFKCFCASGFKTHGVGYNTAVHKIHQMMIDTYHWARHTSRAGVILMPKEGKAYKTPPKQDASAQFYRAYRDAHRVYALYIRNVKKENGSQMVSRGAGAKLDFSEETIDSMIDIAEETTT